MTNTLESIFNKLNNLKEKKVFIHFCLIDEELKLKLCEQLILNWKIQRKSKIQTKKKRNDHIRDIISDKIEQINVKLNNVKMSLFHFN